MNEQSLIPIETINAVEVFTGTALNELLEKIRAEVATIVPDVSTVAGRKDVASTAYKVARSKTAIDDAGKELVAEWKAKSAEVDASRKKARDYLDKLRDEVRAPLDNWEAEQKRIEDERRAAIEREHAAAEAARLAEIERREREIKEREEVLAKAEREAKARADAEEAERNRVALAEQARKDAEEHAAAAVAKAAQDKIEKEELVKRLTAEAEGRAAAMAAAAAAKAERDRLAAEEALAKAEAKRAANVAHRKKINNAALTALTDANIDPSVAKEIIRMIAAGSVPNVTINY